MRIFITGGNGLIGRAVAARLVDSGHEVHLTDLAAETAAPHTTYAVCDIMDYAAVREQLDGCEAVVHMAALRNPLNEPGQEVYRINTVGTFNVFEAAAGAGIRRVVQASSINAMGCAWNIGEFTPRYLPVDEDHAVETSDPYSFSKQQVEAIGAYYWRRDGISSVALRFPGVHPPGGLASESYRARAAEMRAFLDGFAALPEDERGRLLAGARAACLKFRGGRGLEYPAGSWNTTPPEGMDALLWRAYTFDRYNLWAAMDVRDAALSVERGLMADYQGSHALFVSSTRNFLDYPSAKLAALFFPDVSEWKTTLDGAESLVNVSRAREVIGFEPQYMPDGSYHAENR